MDNFNSIKYGLIRSCESSQSLNLRYMNETSTKEFKFMIQMLSSFIGMKRAMLYIDGCISDLFDGLSSRIRNQRLVYDTEHSRWMETYFGNGVLVHFVSLFFIVIYCLVHMILITIPRSLIIF
jgi:hypothetical protein